MTFLRTALSGTLAVGLIGQVAHAQNLGDFDAEGRNDLRAVASVTIPLGGTRSSEDTRPRLDFSMQSEQLGGAQSVTPFRFDPDSQRRSIRPATVSFTLEQSSQVLLNGQRIATFGPTLLVDEGPETEGRETGGGGNTALYVIGGILVLGVAGAVAFTTDVRDAVSDAIGPAD